MSRSFPDLQKKVRLASSICRDHEQQNRPGLGLVVAEARSFCKQLDTTRLMAVLWFQLLLRRNTSVRQSIPRIVSIFNKSPLQVSQSQCEPTTSRVFF